MDKNGADLLNFRDGWETDLSCLRRLKGRVREGEELRVLVRDRDKF